MYRGGPSMGRGGGGYGQPPGGNPYYNQQVGGQGPGGGGGYMPHSDYEQNPAAMRGYVNTYYANG